VPLARPRAPVRPPAAAPATHAADRDSFEAFLDGLGDSGAVRGGPRSAGIATPPGSPVADDLDALRAELERLDPAEDLDPALDGVAFDDELLGTCLHLLATGRDTEVVETGIVRLCDRLMADPTPRQRRMLGAYLRLLREEGRIQDEEARQRLVGFLQRNGVQHLLSTRDTLEVEQVARTFPTQFVAFLDALELKDAGSEQAFAALCDAVGERALDEACRILIEDGTLLTPNRTEKVLKFGGRRVARIARHFVRVGATWTRSQVVNYLRRQGLPRCESAALAIVQPVTALPPAYLADLCESLASGASSAKLHGYTSLLLRQYVRDTADRPGDLERRLYAIRALGFWPSPETVQYLEQLAKEGRILQQGKEARAVRQAAAEALAQLRSGDEGAA
jgi:hypothetical protein